MNAGKVNGKKISMKAKPTPAISIPSPCGLECRNKNTVRKTIKAASIAHVRRTLRRSLSSPTDNDLLFALHEDVLQVVAPSFVIVNRLGSLTGLRMALETSSTPLNSGQSTSATAPKGKRRLCIQRRNMPKSVIDRTLHAPV
jgi:hypothetical protein